MKTASIFGSIRYYLLATNYDKLSQQRKTFAAWPLSRNTASPTAWHDYDWAAPSEFELSATCKALAAVVSGKYQALFLFCVCEGGQADAPGLPRINFRCLFFD